MNATDTAPPPTEVLALPNFAVTYVRWTYLSGYDPNAGRHGRYVPTRWHIARDGTQTLCGHTIPGNSRFMTPIVSASNREMCGRCAEQLEREK